MTHPSDQTVLQILTRHHRRAQDNYHRLPLILSGSACWLSDKLAQLCDVMATGQTVLYSDQDDGPLMARFPNRIRWKKAGQTLGQTINTLIMDLVDGIPADGLGIASGTLQGGGSQGGGSQGGGSQGGGLMILLCPPGCQWTSTSGFHQRASRLLLQGEILHWDQNKGLSEPPQTAVASPRPEDDYASLPALSPYATVDQKAAVTAIKRVKTGHRRRPLVLTADRGRGKSAALGIAAAELMLAESGLNIIVTGPAKKTTDTLFFHAASLVAHVDNRTEQRQGSIVANDSTLTFIAPDKLSRSFIAANLILVDEAAALPAPLLTKLLQTYSRIVFASTIHGYEGTGRGFAIRFHKTLNRLTPKWQRCRMYTPVRWAEDDPAENLINQLLLLNATIDFPKELLVQEAAVQEPAVQKEATQKLSAKNGPGEITYHTLNRFELARDEQLLSQLFGLLISAHYQTSPEDLCQILDRDDLTITVLMQEGMIIAAALLSHEGDFSREMAFDIWAGRRRPKGHLLPQTLAAHAGHPMAPELSMTRIMRIAVHPERQQRGLGFSLVAHIKASLSSQGVDMLGSCFGATEELLSFWQKCQLIPVHIGSTRNAASGCFSVTVTTPLSEAGKDLHHRASSRFRATIYHLARYSLQSMETDILLSLLPVDLTLSSETRNRLQLFTDYQLAIDSYLPELITLFTKVLPVTKVLPAFKERLPHNHKVLLTGRFLQNKSWEEAIRESGVSGKKEAEQIVICSTQNLLQIF